MESWVGGEAEAGEEVRERAVSFGMGQTCSGVLQGCGLMDGYFGRDIWLLDGSLI